MNLNPTSPTEALKDSLNTMDASQTQNEIVERQIVEQPKKQVEIIEIDHEAMNATQPLFYKCPLCTRKFIVEETVKKHLAKFHRFSEKKAKKFGLIINTTSKY